MSLPTGYPADMNVGKIIIGRLPQQLAQVFDQIGEMKKARLREAVRKNLAPKDNGDGKDKK